MPKKEFHYKVHFLFNKNKKLYGNRLREMMRDYDDLHNDDADDDEGGRKKVFSFPMEEATNEMK
jgi:hypothetical protein